MLSFPLECSDCVIKTDGDKNWHLNMRNVIMQQLRVTTEVGTVHIESAKVDACYLISMERQSPCTYRIENSSFRKINLGVTNGSTLILQGMAGSQLVIESNELNIVANLAVSNSEVDLIIESLEQCHLVELVLMGSLQIKEAPYAPILDPFYLPKFGLVYGNLEIPGSLTLPNSFCCLGAVIRT